MDFLLVQFHFTTSQFYILSNNHIMADNNKLPIGTSIIQPGVGEYATDRIAKLSEFISIEFITPQSTPENYVDAAIAEIDSLNLARPNIAFMTIPKGINLNPKIGDFLKGSGATTGYMTGTIQSVSVSIEVDCDGKDAYFVDQIASDMKVTDGDSGAIILDNDNNVVGMEFANTDDETFINPVSHIKDLLKVNIFTSM